MGPPIGPPGPIGPPDIMPGPPPMSIIGRIPGPGSGWPLGPFIILFIWAIRAFWFIIVLAMLGCCRAIA